MEDEFWRNLVINKFEKMNEKLDEQHKQIDIITSGFVRIDQYLKDKEKEDKTKTTSSNSIYTKLFGIIASVASVIAIIAVSMSL